MLYKGPKDIDSLMFFINDKMGIGSLSRKVINIWRLDNCSLDKKHV